MDSNLEKRVYTLSKTEFFEEWMKYGKDDRNKSLFQFISSRYDLQGITEPSERNLKQLISRLSSKISTKWETNGRNSVRFRDHCSSWLQENIVIEVMAHLPEPSSSTQTTFPGPGRPQKDFEDASFKTKKRRVDDLVKSRSASELAVAAVAAEITGLDVNLIKMFDTILRALSSGYDINIDKFVEFTQNTRKLYLSLYSWYYMPATVHKILVHGADIIRSALLPIGQLSEEAQEARNKDCRRFRQNNTRKQSRIATNRDLLNILIITSDPVINSLRENPKKKTGSLPSEVMSLLLPPNVTAIRSIGTRISEDYVVDDSSEDEFSD